MELIIIDDAPPQQHLTKEYLTTYSKNKVLIETGTHLGDTVQLALDAGYDLIHTIEINEELYNNAVKRFEGNDKVRLWLGDSIDCLIEIVNDLTEPATFWLDAHASGPLTGGRSGGSPVLDELRIINNSFIKTHTIFIDDRRLFGTDEWSFVKESDAMDLLNQINPDYKILYLDGHKKGDVICATVTE